MREGWQQQHSHHRQILRDDDSVANGCWQSNWESTEKRAKTTFSSKITLTREREEGKKGRKKEEKKTAAAATQERNE